MSDYNSKFRLFLDSLEEERSRKERLEELAGGPDVSADASSIGIGTASSSELTANARNAANQNAFSGKEWSAQERKIFQRLNSVFKNMIENGDIVRIVPELRQFIKQCYTKLGIKTPGPAEQKSNPQAERAEVIKQATNKLGKKV